MTGEERGVEHAQALRKPGGWRSTSFARPASSHLGRKSKSKSIKSQCTIDSRLHQAYHNWQYQVQRQLTHLLSQGGAHNSPLDGSPANHEISKPNDEKLGGAERSPNESAGGRKQSGGGSPMKSGTDGKHGGGGAGGNA